MAEKQLDEERFFTGKKGERKSFQPTKLSIAIRKVLNIKTMSDSEEMWIYNEQDGLYHKGDQLIKEWATKFLGWSFRKSRVEETIYHIKTVTKTKRKDFKPPIHLIPVANGVIDIGCHPYKLIDYSPEMNFTFKSPVIFDAEAKCRVFDRFLKQILPNELPRTKIQEMFGSCLLRNYIYQKALMMLGLGENGKSTLINTIEILLGKEDNVKNLPLQQLDQSFDKYLIGELYNKLGNFHADITKKDMKRTNIFKLLTGGDSITVPVKFKNAFKFTNFAKLIFSANELPLVFDDSPAFWRRWIFIFFDYVIPSEIRDTDMEKKLTTPEELSGILNWMLEGLERLENQGKHTAERTWQANRKIYLRRADPLFKFIDEHLIPTFDDNEIPKETMHVLVRRYCQKHSLRFITKAEITQRLPRYMPSVIESRPSINKKRTYCWCGVRHLKVKPHTFEVEYGQRKKKKGFFG